MRTVLFLNADYSPIAIAPLSTVNWQEAVKLVWLDQVDVLEYYQDWFVHSPSVTLQVPSVIASRTYVKISRSVKFNKSNLCIRDDYTCQYCMKKFDTRSLTMEHVIPRSAGGKTSWQNIVMACTRCNIQKGHRLDVRPIKTPYKPTYGEIVSKAKRIPIDVPNANWIPYLGWNPLCITIGKNPRYLDSQPKIV